MTSATHCTVDKHKRAGFTLVEMLVVAPLVILLVGVIIGFITTITGDAIATNNRGSLVFSAQQGLDMMERDVRLASNFLDSSDTLASQQRPPTGGAAFLSSNGHLILEQNATSNNPYDSDRKLVYYNRQPNVCGVLEALNNSMKVKLVYFIDKPAGSETGTLYKRTIVPNYSTILAGDEKSACSKPWQANSCVDGFTASASSPCRVRDEKIASDIKSLDISYYVNAASSTAASTPLEANSVLLKLETKAKAAGKTADFKAMVRASKLNPNEIPLKAPEKPIVSTSVSGLTTRFSWEIPDNTTFYDATYGINAPCTANVALTNSRSSFYEVTVPAHGDIVNFCLTAKNIVDSSPSGEASGLVPVWSAAKMDNEWVNYSSTYDPYGFTISPQGEVFLRGLIKNPASPSTVTADYELITTLPPGYRPTYRMFFPAPTYYANGKTNSQTMISVETNGQVKAQANHADSRWVSLAHVRFMSSSASGCPWSNLTLQSNWANWGGAYSGMRVCIDGTNRAHTEGLARPNPSGRAPAGNELIATSPNNGYAPGQGRLIIPSTGYQNYAAFDLVSSSTSRVAAYHRVQNSYVSTQAEYYTSNYTGMNDLSLRSSWINYAGSYAPAQYTKNGNVVTIQGLIKSGTTADQTQIAQLPAGYAPKKDMIYSLESVGTQARVDIRSNGGIYIVSGANPGWISLSGISYVID